MSAALPEKEPDAVILVVDDDRRVRELLEIAFGAHGYRVITAADGEEAVRRAMLERPDLIVLDVRLPKKSGIEVCELLRHEPGGAEIPIVLVSAATENETRLMGFQRGADDYLAKPFSPSELLARAKRLLARTRELRAARERLSDLERDAARAGEESRRAQLEVEQARGLRQLSVRFGEALYRTRDLDDVARHVLRLAQTRVAASPAVLMLRSAAGLEVAAVRG